jgi:hypothetical protein
MTGWTAHCPFNERDGRADPGGDAELQDDPADVRPYGSFADPQAVSHFAVGLVLGDQPQNFALSGAEDGGQTSRWCRHALVSSARRGKSACTPTANCQADQ